MNALKKIMALTSLEIQPRFRDRRAWYASEVLSCARDLYWKATGEPETNSIDFVGQMRMLVGKALEEQLLAGLMKHAHRVGLHHIGTQIQVGTSNPNIDGSLDELVYEAENGKQYVIEYKSKSGAGADFFYNEWNPSDSYLAQMGLYLKSLSEKGVTAEGCFIFILLSDKHFGVLVQIDCKYENGVVTAYQGSSSLGDVRKLDYSLDVNKVLDRMKQVEHSIETKQCPAPTYKYKYELTPEYLATVSDRQLKAAIDGQKILGDWQPRYSRYFDKALKVDGTSREYTAEELALIRNEYNSRTTPTGRKRKQI